MPPPGRGGEPAGQAGICPRRASALCAAPRAPGPLPRPRRCRRRAPAARPPPAAGSPTGGGLRLGKQLGPAAPRRLAAALRGPGRAGPPLCPRGARDGPGRRRAEARDAGGRAGRTGQVRAVRDAHGAGGGAGPLPPAGGAGRAQVSGGRCRRPGADGGGGWAAGSSL